MGAHSVDGEVHAWIVLKMFSHLSLFHFSTELNNDFLWIIFGECHYINSLSKRLVLLVTEVVNL